MFRQFEQEQCLWSWYTRDYLIDIRFAFSRSTLFNGRVSVMLSHNYSNNNDVNNIYLLFINYLFFTEHGTLFTGTINPYSGKPMIYSRSFREPKLQQVFTSLMDQSDFYAGKLAVWFDSRHSKVSNYDVIIIHCEILEKYLPPPNHLVSCLLLKPLWKLNKQTNKLKRNVDDQWRIMDVVLLTLLTSLTQRFIFPPPFHWISSCMVACTFADI